jgi:transposase
MTKPYSVAFKQKMVRRLLGNDGMTAMALARETGVSQQNLSRWLHDARSLTGVVPKTPTQERTVAHKARIIAETAELDADALTAYLRREKVKPAELERWRAALGDRDSGSRVHARQVRVLQRELIRKDKALAETAALLVLQKKVDALYGAAEDDDTEEENEP